MRPLLAILRGLEASEAALVGRALVGAGISRVEVPLNAPGALASIEALARALEGEAQVGEAQVGAGTVLRPAQVAQVAGAGGTLIVSPHLDPEVVREARARGLECWPGVCTPTEAFAAIRAGASALKLFPATLVGPAGLRAWRAVLPPEVGVFPVGGVEPGQFSAWLAAGASGFGLGSSLFSPGLEASEVGRRAQEAVRAYDAAVEALA